MVDNGSWQWLLEGFRFELEARVKPKTVEYYYGHARLFVQWADKVGHVADPRSLTKRDIQSFFHYLAGNEHSPSAKGTGAPIQSERLRWPYYRTLKRFLEWAMGERHLLHNPLEGLHMKAPEDPPVEPYYPEQVERFFRVLDHDWQVAKTPRQKMLAARNSAVLCLFLESGLRLEELSVLGMVDVDLRSQRVLVREGKMGKGRLAGFGPQTKKALWRYMSLRSSEVERDALWITEEGRPMTKHGIQEVIRRLKEDAGLQHVRGSVHKLRHTFATTYLRHTRDMKGCRLLLGHSTLAMTERYTQFIEAEDALRSFDGQGPLDWLRR